MAASKAAKERWRMLRNVLLEKKAPGSGGYELTDPVLSMTSVRRFSSFGLFTVSTSEAGCCKSTSADVNHIKWTRYSYNNGSRYSESGTPIDYCLTVEIALLSPAISREDLQGFNNTGNVCIWPSEEVMAYYCLERREEFRGLSICELGAGMTGLAGIYLAKTRLPKEVFISDGNSKSVSNLRSIIEHNVLSESLPVQAEVVVWKKTELPESHKGRFDIVLCADCLFFTEAHHDLLALLYHILKPHSGKVIMFQPERSGTMTLFRTLARETFEVELSRDYLGIVTEKHEALLNNPALYNPDIHYPIMLTMKQK